MVIAGHETVAGALTWTLMLLAEHPEAQQRLRDELAGLPGPVSMLDHRERIPWTRAVIDEALRLYPPAWAISRRSNAPDVIGGVEVPAGTMAIISPWLVHRRADSWPDPLAFRPERFLEGGARQVRLPSVRAGTPALHRSRLRPRRDGRRARPAPRGHRVGLPRDWVRPEPQALVAVHPRGGMPLVLTRSADARHG